MVPTRGPGPSSSPAARVEPTPPPAFEAGVDLPAGPGRDLLVGSCLGCHDLTTLPLFAPFYERDGWLTLVVTMQAHGADVDNAEVELLADYLAQHF
jgi:hypothetical protein